MRMEYNANIIVIAFSSIVILSFLFTIISNKTNIPSVLLLMATGIALHYISKYYGYEIFNVQPYVKVLGAMGLVMIILEAALDLKINKGKVKLIRNSFFSALIILLASSFAITYLITYFLEEPFNKAFIYAIPMSIISSAIVIPSAENLPQAKREFIIYEASFSDVLGILLFNYMLMKNTFSMETTLSFLGHIILAIVISAVASVLLLILLSKIEGVLKFFLVFAILSILYASGELIHLPALIVILVFGIVINNIKLLIRGPLGKHISMKGLVGITKLMKTVTAETSFLVRTFFFILFGYTINLNVLLSKDVIIIGTAIVAILFIVRYIYLRLLVKTNLFPELFLMPRGLVTVLLFYSIPASMSLSNFKVGILFYVIMLTSILMMVGLMIFGKDKKQDYLDDVEHSTI